MNIWYLKRPLDWWISTQHNAPVSTILLQENSFEPALSGLFFARIFVQRHRICVLRATLFLFAPCHGQVTRASYTSFICFTGNRYA
jgi:hypothetical protein